MLFQIRHFLCAELINKKDMNQLIFNEIKSLKRQILPNEKLILFGSQARGDAQEDKIITNNIYK